MDGARSVEVTDNDLELLKGGVRDTPIFKSSLLTQRENASLASLRIRDVVLQRKDGSSVAFIAPQDEGKLPAQLRESLLRRDSDNAFKALSAVLQQFDMSNRKYPKFDELPDRDLYVKRLQAILDVIDHDDEIRKYYESLAGTEAAHWIETLRECLASEQFESFNLHNINKLVSFFGIASPTSLIKFESAYLNREMQRILEKE